jgi:glutamate racemase
MPKYDYVYFGDNARAPYGTRSFDVVYQYTLEAVEKLFALGCPLVILGCNTASAKALRTIQQTYLPQHAPNNRVLGVIRPTAEVVGTITRNGHIGVLATEGTIKSESYNLEILKLFPDSKVTGLACPMWVPLVENGEYDKPSADYFVQERIDTLLQTAPLIDTILLGCTHYPLLMEKIRKFCPSNICILTQGQYIAHSLKDYLQRHPEMEKRLRKGAMCRYFTSESPERFSGNASLFLNEQIEVERL